MIFKTDVTWYKGYVFKKTGEHVINTDRVNLYMDKDGSSSDITYVDRVNDRRCMPMPATVNSTMAEIEAAFDSVLSGSKMVLPVFLNNDRSQLTVDKYVSYSDFIFSYPDSKDPSYSWVTFMDGFLISKVLVDNSSDELVAAASTPGDSPLSPWKFYRGNTTDWIFTTYSTSVYPAGAAEDLYTGALPTASNFTVSGVTGNPSITSLEFSGSDELRINLSAAISAGDSVTVSYTKGPIYLLDSNQLAIDSFTDYGVIIDN